MKGKRLTPDEREALLADYRLGEMTTQELGAKYGVSASSVMQHAKKAGLPNLPRRGAGSSPDVLSNAAGAWVYDSNGIAHWTPGVVAQPATQDGAA